MRGRPGREKRWHRIRSVVEYLGQLGPGPDDEKKQCGDLVSF